MFKFGDIVKLKPIEEIKQIGKTLINVVDGVEQPSYFPTTGLDWWDTEREYFIVKIFPRCVKVDKEGSGYYSCDVALVDADNEVYVNNDSLTDEFYEDVYYDDYSNCYYVVSIEDLTKVKSTLPEFAAGEKVILKNFNTCTNAQSYFYTKNGCNYLFSDDTYFNNFLCGQVAKIEFLDTAYTGHGELMYRCTVNGREADISPELIAGKYYEEYEIPEILIKTKCYRCGCYYTETKKIRSSVSPEDAILCPDCRKRNFITPYHRYSPHLNFYSVNKKDASERLYLGVEIEVDKGGELNYISAEAKSFVNNVVGDGKHFIYCSHDGSLENGFEMITQPATYKYHKSLEDAYNKMFKYLVSNKYRSDMTSTCGIHVHFSRDYFADDEENNISKLLYVVEKFWDEIVIFSRRDYTTLERYSKKVSKNSYDYGEYIYDFNKSDDHDGHYYAVNITNPNTIELRMFKGTLNIESFMSILDFTYSLVTTVKNKTIEELQLMSFEDMLSTRSKAYFRARKRIIKYQED